MEFTKVVVSGLTGAGLLDLSAADILGPFAPAEGHRVVSISEGTDEYPFDDSTGFASIVGPGGTLRQYDDSDLSYATLVIVFARPSESDAEDTPPITAPYFAIFTTLGLTRLAEAQANSTPLVFAHLAVGDGNGAPVTPDAAMEALVNEVARMPINNVDISPDDPKTVRVEGLLPANVGGFMIHEAGLFNHGGELIAVASYPPIYKPVPAEGISLEEYIRILLVYESVEAIALVTDPDVITATRLYVDDRTAGGLALWERFT